MKTILIASTVVSFIAIVSLTFVLAVYAYNRKEKKRLTKIVKNLTAVIYRLESIPLPSQHKDFQIKLAMVRDYADFTRRYINQSRWEHAQFALCCGGTLALELCEEYAAVLPPIV